eukprot:scaffold5209_cov35-Cyclotella_meneghiniana.AAC.3
MAYTYVILSVSSIIVGNSISQNLSKSLNPKRPSRHDHGASTASPPHNQLISSSSYLNNMMSQQTPKISNKSQRPGTADSGNQRHKKRNNNHDPPHANIPSSKVISGPGDFIKSGVFNMKWDTLGGQCSLRNFTIHYFSKAIKQADLPILVDIPANIIHLSGYSTNSLLKFSMTINQNQIIFDEYSKVNVGIQECKRQCGILMNCIEQIVIPHTQMGGRGSKHKYMLKNESLKLRCKYKEESETVIQNHRNEMKWMEQPKGMKDIIQNSIKGMLSSLPLSDDNHDRLPKRSMCQNSLISCGIINEIAVTTPETSSEHTKTQPVQKSSKNDSEVIKPPPAKPTNKKASEVTKSPPIKPLASSTIEMLSNFIHNPSYDYNSLSNGVSGAELYHSIRKDHDSGMQVYDYMKDLSHSEIENMLTYLKEQENDPLHVICDATCWEPKTNSRSI